jgi:uncharacterized protein
MKRHGLLDLNEAIQHPGRKLRFEVTTSLPSEEDLDLLAPVQGELEAVSTGNILLLKGKFAAKCVVECARCGEPIDQTVEFSMSDEFDVEGVPSGYGTGEYAQVVEEEDYPLFDKNSLLKDVYVRQGLFVNMPVQPLCEFGWDGPCPKAKAKAAKEAAAEEHGHPAMQKLRGLVHPEDD